MVRWSVAFALAVALAGCLQGPADEPGPPTDDMEPAAGDPVRFIALGDMGTGDENQARVAAAMQQVCDERGCDFVIGLGDNIYEVGVTSPYDPQFELKFEEPYAAFDIPFYMTLGNHDNGGVRSLHATGDFQVDYHQRSDRSSDRWQMPDRWYEHQQGPIQFIALDTNIVWSDDGTVPESTALLSADVDAAAQTAFVEGLLAEPAPQPWRIVYGHHTFWSNGDHGDTGGNTGDWLHGLICDTTDDVDFFFSGHDHDLQWIAAKPDVCGDTEVIVSGAGAKTRSLPRDTHESHFGTGDQLGFLWAEVDADSFYAAFYDADAAMLYERTVHKTSS